MVKILARNLRLKKEEEMKNPKLKIFMVKGKPRYAVTGEGSDGTKMFKFINKADFDSYKESGIPKIGGTSGGAKKSKSKSHKKSKRKSKSKGHY